jgi:hypothetical protein
MIEQAADDDPFVALAQVKARRAMADLAGFPHHPSWDELEAAARARLRLRDPSPDQEPVAPSPAAPAEDLVDPILAIAQVKAFRIAADSMGVAHDAAWDATEASAASQLHRSTAPHEGRPPAPDQSNPPG